MSEKKLIIDEDWKAQVQAEKQAAGEAASAGREPSGATAPGAAPAGPPPADTPLPPASFDLLVTSLATEALVALGQLPHPITGQPQVQRNHAQYLIDTIDVLRQKTKGNLSPGEEHMLDSVLHQLRMVFVETAQPS